MFSLYAHIKLPVILGNQEFPEHETCSDASKFNLALSLAGIILYPILTGSPLSILLIPHTLHQLSEFLVRIISSLAELDVPGHTFLSIPKLLFTYLLLWFQSNSSEIRMLKLNPYCGSLGR